MKPGKIRQTVDTSESDREFVRKFEEEVRMLSDMVLEMVRDNKSCLLSPVMRQLLIERAVLVDKQLRTLSNHLVADNPCDDFKWES